MGNVGSDRDLTILLPLRDRGLFTFRWMAYANSIDFPFKVLLADGGADENVTAALSDKTTFSRVDYEYLRYPPDATYRDFYAKVDDALSRIRTPFVAMADNDDFLLVDCLRAAVEFLNGHPDYATCGGQCARLWLSSPGGDGAALYGKHVEWKCSLDSRSSTADTARERLRERSLRFMYPLYYHVQRTDEVTQRFRIVRDLNLTDLFLVEYLLGFLIAIAGKTRQLDALYLVRHVNAPGGSGGSHREMFGDWLGRMLVPSWSEDFDKFVDVTSAALADRDGMSRGAARHWVIDSYRMVIAPALLADLMKGPRLPASVPPAARVRRWAQSLRFTYRSSLRSVDRYLRTAEPSAAIHTRPISNECRRQNS